MAAGGPGQGFLVVWQDARNGDRDIYGQRVSAAGQLLDTEGVPSADPAVNVPLVDGPGDQHMPDVAYSLESDVYLVVWANARPEPEQGVEIGGRRISPVGMPVGEPITIAQEPRAVAHPAVAYNPTAGEFLVVWQRRDILLEDRRLSASGELREQHRIWSSFREPYPAPVPDVVYNVATGEYLVVWEDRAARDIYGQRVSADGAPLGERVTISSADGRQVRPRAGAHTSGYLVIWADHRDPNSSSIYGQLLSHQVERVNAQGTPGAPADVNMPLAMAIPDQEAPVLIFNPGGVEYLFAWTEDRLEGPDVLGQRIWFPAMGPRPTPTPTATSTPTVTPTGTPTPQPTLPPHFLLPVFRNWPGTPTPQPTLLPHFLLPVFRNWSGE